MCNGLLNVSGVTRHGEAIFVNAPQDATAFSIAARLSDQLFHHGDGAVSVARAVLFETPQTLLKFVPRAAGGGGR